MTGRCVCVCVCARPGSQHPGRHRLGSCCVPCPPQLRGTTHTPNHMAQRSQIAIQAPFLENQWSGSAIDQSPWGAGSGRHCCRVGFSPGGGLQEFLTPSSLGLVVPPPPWISPILQGCLPAGDCYMAGGQAGGPATGRSPVPMGLRPPGPWGGALR